MYPCSVLAMNRDESFFRNTAPLQYWPGMGIYCGKDLVKGGTCLGINKKGNQSSSHSKSGPLIH